MNHIFLIISAFINALYALEINLPGIEMSKSANNVEVVEMEAGKSADLICRINPLIFNDQNSSSLYFMEDDTNQRISSNDVAIIDELTAVFMLRNASIQDRLIKCMSDDLAVAVAHIIVGKFPFDVDDFQCRNYAFLYMVCNFTMPNNTLTTNYTLSYIPQNRSFLTNCSLNREGNQQICNLTSNLNFDGYNFSLESANALGVHKQNITIMQFEIVIPQCPVFEAFNITENSAVLKWVIERYSFYKYLEFEISITSKDYTRRAVIWHTKRTKNAYSWKLRKLPYPYYKYNVSVRLRQSPRLSEKITVPLWSETYTKSIRTRPSIPDASPNTDIGSFYIDQQNKINFFWEQVPDYKENGTKFEYVLKMCTEITCKTEIVNRDRFSANYSWDNHKYVFTIKSRNGEGESRKSSRILVPPMREPRKELSPNCISHVFNEANRTYILKWSPPKKQNDLIDYTVFWCRPKQASRNECNSTIAFKHQSKNVTTSLIDAQQELILSVSANYRNYSSGMFWSEVYSDDLGKLEPNFMSTSSEIHVHWSLADVYACRIEGYNLTYCQVHDNRTDRCTATATATTNAICDNVTVFIRGKEGNFTIKDLEPFSTYKIQMFMFSKVKRGEMSDTHFIETDEDVPSPPRNLTFSNRTNNSVELSWLPPEKLNGSLRYYTINYNDNEEILNCTLCACHTRDENLYDKTVSHKLENLKSFTNYTIFVTAHTIGKSGRSNDVKLKTLIGRPSKPRQIQWNNGKLEWIEPELPSGCIDYYEVAIERKKKLKIVYEGISKVVGLTSYPIDLYCIDRDIKYIPRVRAVNVAKRFIEGYGTNSRNWEEFECTNTSGKLGPKALRQNDDINLYESDWETGVIISCTGFTFPFPVFIIVNILLIAGIIMLLYFCARYIRRKNKIKCELPQGLYPKSMENIHIAHLNDKKKASYQHNNSSSEPLCGSDKGDLLSTSSTGSAQVISTPPSDYVVMEACGSNGTTERLPVQNVSTHSGYIKSSKVDIFNCFAQNLNPEQCDSTLITNSVSNDLYYIQTGPVCNDYLLMSASSKAK